MKFQYPVFPVRVSPVIPTALAIMATSFTFMVWLVGEKIYSALISSLSGELSEQSQAVTNTLRAEWLAFPLAITIGLWIWVFLVTTKRQAVTYPI